MNNEPEPTSKGLTFRELLGLHELSEDDFPLGANYAIDQARQARDRDLQPAKLRSASDGSRTFRELVQARAAQMAFENHLAYAPTPVNISSVA